MDLSTKTVLIRLAAGLKAFAAKENEEVMKYLKSRGSDEVTLDDAATVASAGAVEGTLLALADNLEDVAHGRLSMEELIQHLATGGM